MTRSGRPGLVAWIGRVLGAIAAVYLGYVSVLGSKRLVQPATRPFEPPVEGWPTSPADLDLPWEDVRFTTDDGVTLSGWLIPAEREYLAGRAAESATWAADGTGPADGTGLTGR